MPWKPHEAIVYARQYARAQTFNLKTGYQELARSVSCPVREGEEKYVSGDYFFNGYKNIAPLCPTTSC